MEQFFKINNEVSQSREILRFIDEIPNNIKFLYDTRKVNTITLLNPNFINISKDIKARILFHRNEYKKVVRPSIIKGILYDENKELGTFNRKFKRIGLHGKEFNRRIDEINKCYKKIFNLNYIDVTKKDFGIKLNQLLNAILYLLRNIQYELNFVGYLASGLNLYSEILMKLNTQ